MVYALRPVNVGRTVQTQPKHVPAITTHKNDFIRIAVFAPHPDDELIIAGVPIIRASNEWQIRTIFDIYTMTTGNPNNADQRVEELRTAINFLRSFFQRDNIEINVHFLAFETEQREEIINFCDSELKNRLVESVSNRKLISNILTQQKTKPHSIITTHESIKDQGHPDHERTYNLISYAVNATEFMGPIFTTHIWGIGQLPFNTIIGISETEYRILCAALEKYRTQNKGNRLIDLFYQKLRYWASFYEALAGWGSSIPSSLIYAVAYRRSVYNKKARGIVEAPYSIHDQQFNVILPDQAMPINLFENNDNIQNSSWEWGMLLK